MKYIFLLISLTMTLQLSAVNIDYSVVPQIAMKQIKKVPKEIRYDYLAATSGILGLALVFLPIVSIVGILLGLGAIVFSIIAFKKQQKSRWRWIGLVAGSLTLIVFLGVVGLLLFF